MAIHRYRVSLREHYLTKIIAYFICWLTGLALGLLYAWATAPDRRPL